MGPSSERSTAASTRTNLEASRPSQNNTASLASQILQQARSFGGRDIASIGASLKQLASTDSALGGNVNAAVTAQLTPVEQGELRRATETRPQTDMAALQRDNFPAYVAALRPTLAPQDRDNPFAYSLGTDVPIEVKRQVYAEYQSGRNAPSVEIGSMAGANASFDESAGPNGTIRVNADLIGNRDLARAGQFEAFAVWGHLEEIGHWGDMRAQQIMGRPGADSLGDEGARFALMALPTVTAGGNPQNGFIGSYDIRLSNGTTQTVQFDTVVLKALAGEKLASGSFASENRVDGVEHFGPEGHYQTTYITAAAVGIKMGMTAAEADTMANQMALGSQLPDMLRNFDATSLAIDSIFSLPPLSDFIPTINVVVGQSNAYIALGELPIKLRESEWEHLARKYEAFHGITEDIARDPAQIAAAQSRTRDFIIEKIGSGDFLTAGVAMHLYGDLYAHVNSDGNGYAGVPGHFWDGHMPDSLYSYSYLPVITSRLIGSAQLRDTIINYQADLSDTIAQGLASYLSDRPDSKLVETATQQGVETWRQIYDNSLTQSQPPEQQYYLGMPEYPIPPLDPEEVFATNAGDFIADFHDKSGGKFAPLPFEQTGVEGHYSPTENDVRSLLEVGEAFD